MKKAIMIVIILFLALAAAFAGFWFVDREEAENNPSSSQPETSSKETEDIEANAVDEYTLYDDVNPSPTPLTCITIPTTLTDLMHDKEVTLSDADARELEAFFASRSYDSGMCKCMPEYTISNSRGTYSVNLSQLYARSEKKQTDITTEQMSRIKKIIDKYFQ